MQILTLCKTQLDHWKILPGFA